MQNTVTKTPGSNSVLNLGSIASGSGGQIVISGASPNVSYQTGDVTSNGGVRQQVVAKVMYSPPESGEEMEVGGVQTVDAMDYIPGQQRYTPTKTITVTSGRVATSLHTTPTKQIVTANKIAISPKSPIRAMTSPNKVLSSSLPAGQRLIITNNTVRPQTVTSPHRVVIKPSQSVVKSGVVSPSSGGVLMSNSKFQYVRLVSQAPTPSTATRSITFPTSQPKSILPAGTAPARKMIQQVVPKTPTQSQQRVILPANGNVILPNTGRVQQPIRPASSTLPVGTTLIQGSGTNMQSFALVPSQYVNQFQKTSSGTCREAMSSSQPAARATNSSIVQQPAGASRPRKPCNCTKSMCLKLYCDCFANGEFCHNCNCNNCSNNLEHEEERARAVKQCLDRNPNAFHPKIGKGANGIGGKNRRHIKGCNCKRSGCLKNYCECYEAKISCSSICKCVGCKNVEDAGSPGDHKHSHMSSDPSDVRGTQLPGGRHIKTERPDDVTAGSSRGGGQLTGSDYRRPDYSFLRLHEVAEATCRCLFAFAEDAERQRQTDIEEERVVLAEFGRCLQQIVQSANHNKGSHPT